MSTRRMMMASASHVKDGVIQDSWEEIAEACNKGLAEKYYSLGDVKEVDFNLYGATYTLHMEICGFNCVLKEEGRAASTAWCSQEVMYFQYDMGMTSLIQLPDSIRPHAPNCEYLAGYNQSTRQVEYDIAQWWSPGVHLMEKHYELYFEKSNRIKKDAETGKPCIWCVGSKYVRADGTYSTSESIGLTNARHPLAFCL